VDTSIVTKKLQAEHPNWKLLDRRVNKFVKRSMNKHKNPAGADDDQTASMYMRSSSKRGIFGIFSPSKRTNLVTEPAVIPDNKETKEVETTTKAVPDEDPASLPKEENEETTSPLPDNEKDAVEETNNKDMAYETDNSVVESSHDCWGLSCAVM
jgi:hypothetical protein